MPKPLVSIIIPAYNGQAFLHEALGSVFAQSYTPIQVIVVDNGSQDATASIAQSYKDVHFHYLPTSNTADARNAGVALAKGTYIAFLDQDDLWEKEKLEKQVAFLENNPDFEAVICHQITHLEKGAQKPHWLKKEFLLGSQLSYFPSALMARKSFLDQTPFDLSFSVTSDVAWFFDATYSGIKIGKLKEVLITRRIHKENTTNHCNLMHKELLGVLRHSLTKRRLHD